MSLHSYPEYVDSPIHWLHKQPITWAAKPVKVIASINDETLTEAVDSERTIEYVDIGSVSLSKGIEKTETLLFGESPSRARRVPREGDVLVSTVRTYLKAIAPVTNQPSNLVASTGFAVVRPRPEIEPSYLKYALQEEHFIQEVISRSTGVSYPAINACDIGRVLVSVPGKDEQQVIATFLDRETAKIDALIAEQQRLIELLQEKRQAVISHAVTKGLNPNAPMKDSGVEWLGEVPEHWEVLELKRLNMEGSSITYGIVQAGPHQENGVPYIRTSDMSGDRLLLETCQRTSPEIDEAYARSKVSEGDLVIAIRATVGKTLEVPKELDGANLTQGTAKFSPGERVTSGFMKLAFASSYSQAQIASIAKGATFLEITLDALRRLAFAVPPKDEARQITHYLSERCAVIDTLTTNSEEACSLLKERRSALISAAVTGQIDVRGLAAEVAA